MTLLQQLEIQQPIFLAPMAGVSTPQLAAEVSNKGGLGALGLGAANVPQAEQQILATKALTDAPFQVNFFCHQSVSPEDAQCSAWLSELSAEFAQFNAAPPTHLNCIYPSFIDHDDYLRMVLETKPKVVSFHFGIPLAHQIRALKAAGIMTMVTATNLIEAQRIEAAGIDVIIAQGIEAGGHRGVFNPAMDAAINTQDLVRLIVQHCHIPVVAAGGIMTGQQIRHFLALGASAVQMGTAFVQCKSSSANDAYRAALFDDPMTQITDSISGRPARGLINHWHRKIDRPERASVAPYPYAYDAAKQLHALAAKQGEHGYGAFWAGSNVAQIRQLEAADLINQLVLEMSQA